MEEVLLGADAADAARIAVEQLLLPFIVEERALQAGIRAKGGAAAAAVVRHRLLRVAHCTDELPHRAPVQLVPQLGVLYMFKCSGSALKIASCI